MRRTVVTALIVAGPLSVWAAGTPYRLAREIPVGGAGGWDYISVDAEARRVYVSHSTMIVVLDADRGTLIGEISDTRGVHGIAIASDLGRGFTSNGGENTSTIVDLKTLKPLGKKVETGGNPDAVVYTPDRREVYTFNGSGRSATVIDARAGKVVATIDLGGKPEAAVVDAAAHRIFVNIEDTASLTAIDTVSRAVRATWRLAGCEEPTGLAYDAAHRRLFSACHNKVMTVTDSTTGRQVTTIPIGARVDGAAFDPKTGYAFTSNGEGTVTIATVDESGKATVVQTLTTQPSARTIALDPRTHEIYLPAATIKRAAARGARPEVAPDSFKVLVYGPVKARATS